MRRRVQTRPESVVSGDCNRLVIAGRTSSRTVIITVVNGRVEKKKEKEKENSKRLSKLK